MAIPFPRSTFDWIKSGEQITGTPLSTPSLPRGVANRLPDKLLSNDEYLDLRIDGLKTDLASPSSGVSVDWSNIINEPSTAVTVFLNDIENFSGNYPLNSISTFQPLLHIYDGTHKFGFTSFNLNKVIISNDQGGLSASAITTTQLNYLSGVSSNIQTQLNSITAKTNNATASEFSFLSGTTSSIQSQLNNRYTKSELQTAGQSSINVANISGLQAVSQTIFKKPFFFLDTDLALVNSRREFSLSSVGIPNGAIPLGKIFFGYGDFESGAITYMSAISTSPTTYEYAINGGAGTSGAVNSDFNAFGGLLLPYDTFFADVNGNTVVDVPFWYSSGKIYIFGSYHWFRLSIYGYVKNFAVANGNI